MARTRLVDDARKVRSTLAQLAQLDLELKRRIQSEDPKSYGLPDLLRPKAKNETDEQFVARQDAELKEFIETKLWFVKNAHKQFVKLAPPMLKFLADLFYQRVNQAILWKPRGGGGSLCGSILIWLMLVYHKQSVTDMAGSAEQAKIIYEYTKGLWDCMPELSKAILAKEPLQGETRLKNGVILKTISATEKQVRGKHNPIFISDESCQAADNTDQMVMAAMQGAMSETPFTIVLLSTFHHPIGLFQEVWDFAEERGFARYKWDIIDAMEKCDAGMETATPEDPEALNFCRTQCPLTKNEIIYDENGVVTGTRRIGCDGRARHSQGFMTRKNVMVAEKMNRGTKVFEVEYLCQRPDWMRPVYPSEWIEASLVDDDWPPPRSKILEKSIGIDWGLEGQTCLTLSALIEVHRQVTEEEQVARRLMDKPPVFRCVGVLEAEFMSGKLVPEVLKILAAWMERYGQDKFFVYGDASHPYNNQELDQAGFDMRPVPFAKWKDYGIGNITKYFTTGGRLFMRRGMTAFLDQMKRYRQDRTGKPIKKDDHGPDSLLCGMLHFMFEERFGADLELTEEEIDPLAGLTPEQKMLKMAQVAMTRHPMPDGISIPGMNGGISLAPLPTDVQSVVKGIRAKQRRDGQVFTI